MLSLKGFVFVSIHVVPRGEKVPFSDSFGRSVIGLLTRSRHGPMFQSPIWPLVKNCAERLPPAAPGCNVTRAALRSLAENCVSRSANISAGFIPPQKWRRNLSRLVGKPPLHQETSGARGLPARGSFNPLDGAEAPDPGGDHPRHAGTSRPQRAVAAKFHCQQILTAEPPPPPYSGPESPGVSTSYGPAWIGRAFAFPTTKALWRQKA